MLEFSKTREKCIDRHEAQTTSASRTSRVFLKFLSVYRIQQCTRASSLLISSSETQGQLVGAGGNKSGKKKNESATVHM